MESTIDGLQQSGSGKSANPGNRLVISPPGGWVTPHEPNLLFSLERPGVTTLLLLDVQQHAELRQEYRRVVYRLETLHAVHQAAQWKLRYDSATESVAIHSILIRRGDDSIEQADPERFRYLSQESALDPADQRGDATVLASLESVRLGDVLDVSYTVTRRAQILPNRFSALLQPPEGSFGAARFSVLFAGDRPLKWVSKPHEVAPSVEDTGELVRWSWEMKTPPEEEPEQSIPAWHRSAAWIQVSDCESWGEIASAFSAAWDVQCTDPAVEAAAREIARTAPTLLDRAEAAIRLVQDEIRHSSSTVGLGGTSPISPDRLLKQRVGNCRDKSSLLAQLLRRLGISARPVLVNAQLAERVRDFLPTVDAFDHAAVEYELEGKRFGVDPTIALQGGGPTRRWTATYGLCLPIAPGTMKLEPYLTNADAVSFYDLHETFALDSAGGPSLLKIIITAGGHDADDLRSRLALDGREEFGRKQEQIYRGIFPEFRRVRTIEVSDDRAANEIKIGEAFEILGGLTPTADQSQCTFSYRAHLIQQLIAYPSSEKRRHPLSVPFPCRAEHRIDLESPGLEVLGNQVIAKRDEAFRFNAEMTGRPGRRSHRFRLQTLADHVDADRFPQHRKKADEVWRGTGVHALLPIGVAQPRRRLSSSLFEEPGKVERPGPSGNAPSSVLPASALPLPDEPAPLLGPAPVVETAPAAPTERRPSPEADSPRPGPSAAPEASRSRQSERRRSSRSKSGKRRKSQRGGHRIDDFEKSGLFWGILGCMAILMVVIICYLLTRQ